MAIKSWYAMVWDSLMPRPHLAHVKKRGLGTRLGLGSEYEAAGLNDVGTDEKRYLNVLKSQSLNHPPACVEEEGGGGRVNPNPNPNPVAWVSWLNSKLLLAWRRHS